MVLGSPLLHALSGLARARLGWLCPRAWGGELVVRVSNRLVRRAVGCLHGSCSVRGRGVLTGGCLAAGLTTASMAPKPKTKFTQDKKAQPGEGRDRSNRVTVNLKAQGLPGLFAEGLFRPDLSPGQQMSQVADAAEKGSAGQSASSKMTRKTHFTRARQD